jgi:hypothetical protein
VELLFGPTKLNAGAFLTRSPITGRVDGKALLAGDGSVLPASDGAAEPASGVELPVVDVVKRSRVKLLEASPLRFSPFSWVSAILFGARTKL